MTDDNQVASKRLVIGTITYMLGNLTSKILQILILPIITAALSTAEYGYYDLLVTTISLVTPVVTFQMIEGMFRFMFDATEEEQKMTVSTVTAFLVCGCFFLATIFLILGVAVPVVKYPILIYLNYVSSMVFNYMQKLARCQQKNRQFATSGVINTIVMLGCQAFLLIVLHLGVEGMLVANAVSYLVASLYLGLQLHIRQWLSCKYISITKFIELFKYSAPLIPNSVGWWVVASSDRYVITGFLGTSFNGIYSIAGKFSQMLTFVTTVFQLAWQESAIMEERSDKRDKFYTETFNTYMKLLMGAYLIILPLIKLLIPILLADSYQIGYLYNPVLLIGAVFSAFSQFYGSAYLVFKKTGGAFYTTVVAAVVNVLIGVGLIQWIGLFAPALGTAVAFFVQWILRAHQMKDYFKVKIDKKSLVVLLVCMGVVSIAYYCHGTILQIVMFLLGTAVFLAVNKEVVATTIDKIRHKVRG